MNKNNMVFNSYVYGSGGGNLHVGKDLYISGIVGNDLWSISKNGACYGLKVPYDPDYSGRIHMTNIANDALKVDGGIIVGKGVDITGGITCNNVSCGDLIISGNSITSNTLLLSNNVVIGNDLSAGRNVNVVGDLNVDGNSVIKGSSTLKDNVVAEKDLSVGGNLHLNNFTMNKINVNEIDTTELVINGKLKSNNHIVNGSLNVSGLTTLKNVSGVDLNVANSNVSNKLSVSGDGDITGNLKVGGVFRNKYDVVETDDDNIVKNYASGILLEGMKLDILQIKTNNDFFVWNFTKHIGNVVYEKTKKLNGVSETSIPPIPPVDYSGLGLGTYSLTVNVDINGNKVFGWLRL